ncbi:L,D-transpeptidase [uncultured Bradyrhizobium sp.]|jgi:lipoprotein-anchoring transpeptidase ErfK/SrfK|uniref:L,D-transpeptidase n=1 Tax=uncultured Bradyrhizobium sp. TaxID=199684 RepID=UPI0026094CF5|nr:L,D-transpeptidase [uncultured Bradyrhizobium sp.]
MAKRAKAKRGKAETLAIPMAARVAIGAVAVAALGYGVLSQPASVQPARKPAAQEARASSSPVYVAPQVHAAAPVPTPVPAPILAPAPLAEPPKADAEAPGALVRQVVDYASRQTPGTVIIDTGNTFLYFVLNDRQAMRYGIGVGREGFTWSGEQTVARKAEWPDWHPPTEMIGRQPYLPRFMAGGPGNPLGARAMYLGETEYRIHGTNNPATIGKKVSSGCIRLTNDDVTDLYERVKVGAKVIVLPAAASRRPSQGQPSDAASRSPDPASPSKRPLAANAQMLSPGPRVAEAR